MTSHLDNDLKQSGITDSFQRDLLAAGKTDALSKERRERIVASIGLAVGAPVGLMPDSLNGADSLLDNAGSGLANSGQLATHVAPSGVIQASGLQALAAKIVGAAALGGLSIWGGYNLLGSTEDRATAPAAAAAVAEPREAPAVESAKKLSAPGDRSTIMNRESAQPNVDSNEGVEAEVSAGELPEAVARNRKQGASDTLTRELALIEAGRAELLRNNPSAALNTLNKYRKEFPKGTLSAEATVLRVEALIASGNRSAASRVGEAFLLRSPNSPYSRRISSLLGGTHDVGAKAADPKR